MARPLYCGTQPVYTQRLGWRCYWLFFVVTHALRVELHQPVRVVGVGDGSAVAELDPLGLLGIVGEVGLGRPVGLFTHRRGGLHLGAEGGVGRACGTRSWREKWRGWRALPAAV